MEGVKECQEKKTDNRIISGVFSEFKSIIASQKFKKALQALAQDKALLAKAKADPRKYLKAQAIIIPSQIVVDFGDAHTICLKRKVKLGMFTVTLTVCTTFFL